MNIKIESPEEKELVKSLKNRSDADAKRMLRFLNMPDLTRTPGSPLADMVGKIINIKDFKDFDIVEAPEIVPANVSFDLFDFPADHPARSKSDTYYASEAHVLRTHTTVMWYYYLNDPQIKERMAREEIVGSFSFGKVYRKDEIDRQHMNVFHQIDGWLLAPKSKRVIGQRDLEDVLGSIAKAVFGPDVKYRFNPDTFPYTDPSLEMEIKVGDKWIEGNGCGVVKGRVLKKCGVDPEKWTGWAFGFGLERLAMLSMDLPDIRLLWSKDERVKKQLKLGNKFKEVSKFPPITRDISFIVSNTFIPNNYFDLIRDLGGDLVEEVSLLDKYENAEKFGADKTSYTYRIVYRSNERTLTNEEIDKIQSEIYRETSKQFASELR
ncbi:hypothetical protein HYW53_01705 [Candidatus Giovannonibacteria bacterium]|nr:hypothetical protein [Candidatus Giovannonibacteria bacterium]